MADFDDLVRTEAYLIWDSEGRPHGQDCRHWQIALERVEARVRTRAEAPVVPLSLKRVALSARLKHRSQAAPPARASA